MREAIGPDVDLLVDGNHGWTVTEAIQFARRIEEFEPYWLEEPVESQHPRANAEVTMAVNMPTASGENLQGRHAFRNLIDAHGADIIQADAFNCGGITEWRKIAAYAQAHNLRMAPHGNAVVGSHLVASMTHGLIVESGPMQDGQVRSALARRVTVRPLHWGSPRLRSAGYEGWKDRDVGAAGPRLADKRRSAERPAQAPQPVFLIRRTT